MHGQIARGEAVRVVLPLLLRATRGDKLQYRRIPRQQHRLHFHATVVAVDGAHGKAGGVEHHIDLVLARHGLQQRHAFGVFERVQRQGQGVEALLCQRGQHGVKRGSVAGLQMSFIEHQQGCGRALAPGRHLHDWLVAHRTGQHLRRRRPLAPAKGGMGYQLVEVVGVVAPTFAQAAPQVGAVVFGGGAAQEQLCVFHTFARHHHQPLAARGGGFTHLVDDVGPVAGGAQVFDDDGLGVAQHIVHVQVGGRGLAQPHQVGQAHARKISRQVASHFGQERQGGVGHGEHHDVAGRLLHAHDAVAIVFDMAARAGGEQMHGELPLMNGL